MPWSDSTHLADFGTASLWPIYVQFGNQSKYERAKPSARACHHAAYIPKFLKKEGIDPLLTHCRRELMHAIWKLLLSDKFVAVCRHGIVVKCHDGVTRRLYIRIFTYSADYPEKVMLATVRDMGNCPCPRCLVPKEKICELGTSRDQDARDQKKRVDDEERKAMVQLAQTLILEKGLGVNSTAVEGLLKARSLVPTSNAFSERLAPDVVPNFHNLFVPDILHEWELGVWKSLMTHLVRILHAAKGGVVREFNARFRLVPTFGLDIIRRFNSNMADMKQFAAHDFEDALQCFIPVVDRLLPEPHNGIVLDVIFLSAQLHGMHKFHLHTESSTRLADAALTEYGKALRRFKRVTCAAYNTVELQKELAARVRRLARHHAPIPPPRTAPAEVQGRSQAQIPQGQADPGARLHRADASAPVSSTITTATACLHGAARKKEYSLNTFKLHSLGDYTKKNYTTQLAQIERREEHLHRITSALNTATPLANDAHQGAWSTSDSEELAPFSEWDHHHIAKSQKHRVHLSHYVYQHRGDRAVQDFICKLQTHLLACTRHNRNATDASFSEADRRALVIEHERIYSHQLLRINYTTYDVRRGQDLINPSTEPNEDSDANTAGEYKLPHMFWYAQVLGIYHANVVDRQPREDGSLEAAPQRMEFLFVGFVPDTDPDAFGFVDPSDIVRACHLIPAFAEGRTSRLLGYSKIARPSGESDDWERFYVNRFVDRDMVMRYLGGGKPKMTWARPYLFRLVYWTARRMSIVMKRMLLMSRYK
ncbi:hypothetical protein C8Q79DRAFT_999321 [Trametes meyenii]|nr:hypothetical protein C8Q79DRAFT_999321 [Trametes meyenii]